MTSNLSRKASNPSLKRFLTWQSVHLHSNRVLHIWSVLSIPGVSVEASYSEKGRASDGREERRFTNDHTHTHRMIRSRYAVQQQVDERRQKIYHWRYGKSFTALSFVGFMNNASEFVFQSSQKCLQSSFFVACGSKLPSMTNLHCHLNKIQAYTHSQINSSIGIWIHRLLSKTDEEDQPIIGRNIFTNWTESL